MALDTLIWYLGSMICRHSELVTGKWWKYRGLEIGAGTGRTCGKLIIFGLAVIAFATTHGSQRGVQFAPKWSDHIHHNIQVGASEFPEDESINAIPNVISNIKLLKELSLRKEVCLEFAGSLLLNSAYAGDWL